MFVEIAFFIGIALLIKGPFRIAGRNVSRQVSRRSAFALMAPLIIMFVVSICAGMSLASDNPDTIDFNAIFDIASRVYSASLIVLVVVIALVIYQIYVLPKSDVPLTPATSTPTPVPFTPHNVMTPAETALYLRITEAQVRELIDAGQLPAARIGGDYRIARVAVDDFLNQHKADADEDFSEFKD